ncbi:hypothetical protein [Actinophytocola sp.]|uniref:hypothetical protein n=1 Tax=Actinophytocola sp. TaxID=1872138 RepID=UPI002ED05792
MAAAWNDAPAAGGLNECAALVRSAEALRTSAPELSVQLARRALLVGATDFGATAVNVGEARSLSMRAKAVLAAGLVRTSQYAGAVEPGFEALALAESAGALVLAAEIRLDLAACAQDLGEPLLGGGLLRPVLEAGHAPPSVRAAALGRLVGCIAHVARRDDVEDALSEADRLLAADDGLNPDARRIERARLAVRSAAYHRWYGDNEDAVTAARDGLTLLGRLRRELRADSDRLRTRLVLELVCALLDEGELWEAEETARPTLEEPVRATSAASVGQLMLAVATRVHLPAGGVDRGRGLVSEAAWLAERHGQDSVLADALTELSRLDEQAGRAREALEALRAARAAEQRRMRAMSRAARHMLVQVGAAQGGRDVTQQAAALLRQLAHPTGVPVAVAPPPVARATLSPSRTPEPPAGVPAAPTEGTTEKSRALLDREGLFRRLRAVRKGERPVALTLVRFEPNNGDADPDEADRGPDTGIMVGLADKVRDLAPKDAEVARSDGGELAVLLPHTTRDQAEEFAAAIRETAWLAGSGKDMSISTGVVSDPQTTDTPVDAAGLLTAARDALTPVLAAPTTSPQVAPPAPEEAPVQEPAPAPEAAAPSPAAPAPKSALAEDTPTTPLHAATTNDPTKAGRSILNSLSIQTGSGGRRRASGSDPGEEPRRATDPAVGQRWTRTENGPTADETAARESPEPSGWPAEPDISQPLRPPTPTPAATSAARPRTADAASSYDETRAELARMMSELNAKALRARTNTAQPATTQDTPTEGDPSREQPSAHSPSAAAEAAPPAATDPRAAAAEHTTTGADAGPGQQLPTGVPNFAAPEQAPTTISDPAATPTSDSGGGFAGLYGSTAQQAHANHTSTERDDSAAGADRHGSVSALTRFGVAGAAERSESASDSGEGSGSGGGGGFAGLYGSTAQPASPDHAATERPDPVGGADGYGSAGESARFGAGAAERAEQLGTPEWLGSAGLAERFGSARPLERYDSAGSVGWHGSAVEGSSPAERHDLSGSAGQYSAEQFGSDLAADRGPAGEPPTPAAVVDQFDVAAVADVVTPRQSIPTPPTPDEMPQPPGGPDIPEPPSRPDIPQPPEPDVTPEREPGSPRPPGVDTRSRLMAAFDALTGPVPTSSDEDPEGVKSGFRVDLGSGIELPSRKPLTSWAALESSAVVESPAEGLFGKSTEPGDTPPSGAAFSANEPDGLSAVFEQRTSSGFLAVSAPGDRVGGAAKGEPSVAEREPSGASAGLSATTYDHPIGPEPRPEGLPRRGERSATTIASLLTEALAAYQATGDDGGDEEPRTPDRFDSFMGDPNTAMGRHRSPE